MAKNILYDTVSEAFMSADSTSSRDLEIKGATLVSETSGGVVLRIAGLARIEPDWQEIENLLQKAGVPEELVPVLTNEFANRTELMCLAHALASRIVR